MRKTKAKLIMTLSVALLSVFTMGVSTFAWFQAQANVNIQTESTSTTITVSKPDDFIFYAYKGNMLASWDSPGTFDNDFIQVTSTNLAAQTFFDGELGHGPKFNPGEIKSFALYFKGHVSTDPICLQITDVLSQTVRNRDNTKHRYEKYDNTNYEINIGWNINMYSMLVTSLTNHKPLLASYSTFVSSKTGKITEEGSDGTDRITLTRGSNVIGSNSQLQTPAVPLNTTEGDDDFNKATGAFDLYPQNKSVTQTEGYLFYSIVFNDGVADRYGEVATAASEDVTPLLVPTSNATRYYVKNSTSPNTALYNSNCFADLTFHISMMDFKF